MFYLQQPGSRIEAAFQHSVSPPDLPSRFPRRHLNYLQSSPPAQSQPLPPAPHRDSSTSRLLQRLVPQTLFAMCTCPHCTALRQFLPHRARSLRSLAGLLLLPLQLRF